MIWFEFRSLYWGHEGHGKIQASLSTCPQCPSASGIPHTCTQHHPGDLHPPAFHWMSQYGQARCSLDVWCFQCPGVLDSNCLSNFGEHGCQLINSIFTLKPCCIWKESCWLLTSSFHLGCYPANYNLGCQPLLCICIYDVFWCTVVLVNWSVTEYYTYWV